MAQHDDRLSIKEERKRQEWARRDQADLDAAVLAMLQSRETRRYLWWLLQIGNAIGENPFRSNAMLTAFGCGAMDVGNRIMKHLLDVSGDGFIKVLKEHDDERKQRELELSTIRDDADPGRRYQPDWGNDDR
jgi:hypothetical protein